MIGVMMFSEIRNINFKDPIIVVSTFATIILMPLTYSITIGLSVGFILYFILALLKGEFDKINIGIVVLALIGLLAVIFH